LPDDRRREAKRRLAPARWSKDDPPLAFRDAIEKPQKATILVLLIATELLATDVLGVVMARTMWARQEKSSAGFHFVGPIVWRGRMRTRPGPVAPARVPLGLSCPPALAFSYEL
jgi:hypothetical protein